MNSKNCIQIRKFSPFRIYYCYLDLPNINGDYYGDHYFYKYGCHIKFTGNEFKQKESDYRFILCSVPRAEQDRFLSALEELDAGLTLIKGKEYVKIRDQLMETIKIEKEGQSAT